MPGCERILLVLALALSGVTLQCLDSTCRLFTYQGT